MATRSQDTDDSRQRDRTEQSQQASTRTTTDKVKQAIPAVLGGVILYRGLRRRSLRGIAMAVVGGWLLYRTFGGSTGTDGRSAPRTADESEEDRRLEASNAMEVSRSITVGKPADELYETWRDPETFSRVMGHFAEVTSADGDRFHWTVHGPRGREISWESRTVAEVPGEFVQWETTGDAMVPNQGSVRFRPAPGDRGTEVTLSVRFDPPGGTLGRAALERLEIAPKTLAATALRRFKSLVESGEIQTLKENPSARGTGDLV